MKRLTLTRKPRAPNIDKLQQRFKPQQWQLDDGRVCSPIGSAYKGKDDETFYVPVMLNGNAVNVRADRLSRVS